MREIKFRIWNPASNNLLFDIENVYECLMQQHAFDKTQPTRGLTPSYDHKADGMVWMQYTGLKDKNGVEIYEGDIVLAPSGTCIARTVTCAETGETLTAYKDNPPNQYIIHNVGYAFTLGKQDNPDYAGVLNNGTNKRGWQLEVIGNIYQHSELLKP